MQTEAPRADGKAGWPGLKLRHDQSGTEDGLAMYPYIRESRRIQVQINCVFKDEQGFSTGDETPFQTLILSENSTEAVRFTAMNTQARKYTVRVRQAR